MQDFTAPSYSVPSYSPQEFSPVSFIICLIFFVFWVIVVWKMYVKAGKPGWAAIIPFYNIYVLLQIVGKPGWWLILYLVPFVNIYITIVVAIRLAKTFGKSTTFGVVALWLFAFIGYIILAFDKSKYQPIAETSSPKPQVQPVAAESAPTVSPSQPQK